MAKLKGALDYFSSNNPGSIELENVRSLHSSGGGQLFREFSEQLKKHSRPVPVIEILNCVAASDSVCGDEVTSNNRLHSTMLDDIQMLFWSNDVNWSFLQGEPSLLRRGRLHISLT